MRRGVIIRTVINNLTFDGATQDPMQQAVRDALTAFMAATAQAQAEATKEAQRAGIEHAKVNAETNGNRYRGRKPKDVDDALHVAPLLDQLTEAPTSFMGDGAYDRSFSKAFWREIRTPNSSCLHAKEP